MARLSRGLAAAVALAVSGACLAACGGGNADAVAACHGVHEAIVASDRAAHQRGAARARDDLLARRDLAGAEQPAALANSSDGSYNALMTLLELAQTMPVQHLLPALRSTCASINAPNF